MAEAFSCGARFEAWARRNGAECIAGVDEVGRGALFGPVVAAAVILNPAARIAGLNDSKQLEAEVREQLDRKIRARALGYAIAAVDAAGIDAINILQASRRAMLEALHRLPRCPDFVLVDAVTLDWAGPQRALIHGDARSVSIAAASIVAKVYRDRLMQTWDPVFPAYRLGSNKGYGTPHHIAALQRYGPTPLHRQSFAPVGGDPQRALFPEQN
jgi:ribonuclease HII